MNTLLPSGVSADHVGTFILGLADDELILGHRDSEWTGHAPILEEDIAFSNIAQEEIGHALVWYTLYQELTGRDPDSLAFGRDVAKFECCHLVEYPKDDFAYTVVRQYLFDVAEQVRLDSLLTSTSKDIADIAGRLRREESYHRLHLESLVTRLGNATAESSKRMQAAVDLAFPQALGIFEAVEGENALCAAGVFNGNEVLQRQWLQSVTPVLLGVNLKLPVVEKQGVWTPTCSPDVGGRKGRHTDHLKPLLNDMQSVYNMAPNAKW